MKRSFQKNDLRRNKFEVYFCLIESINNLKEDNLNEKMFLYLTILAFDIFETHSRILLMRKLKSKTGHDRISTKSEF
jgi:hypothetical protein